MWGWEFYDVDKIDKDTGKFIECENFEELNEAIKYATDKIKNKLLDYNEILVIYKRNYDCCRELTDEEIVKVYDNGGEQDERKYNV